MLKIKKKMSEIQFHILKKIKKELWVVVILQDLSGTKNKDKTNENEPLLFSP